MSNNPEIKWLPKPEDKDYTAAASYLSLFYDETTVQALVEKLKKASVSQFKAKDIFRASSLSLLGVSNSHVKNDRKKIKGGNGLLPILMVRDQKNSKTIIADGYHRLCAVYSFSEDAYIPCKIV